MRIIHILRIVFPLFAAMDASMSQGQIVSLSGSLSHARMLGTKVQPLGEYIQTYMAATGIEYWEHPHFSLFSSLSVRQEGGATEYRAMEGFRESVIHQEERSTYLSTSTLYRLYHRGGQIEFFAGLGPCLNIRLAHRNHFKDPLLQGYRLAWVTLGGELNGGFRYWLGAARRICLGLQGGAILDLTPAATSAGQSLRGLSFHVAGAVGCRIR